MPFLPEKMKTEKVEKLEANLNDQIEYVIHIENLKQALNLELIFKNGDKLIKFNQNSWLKPYSNMQIERKKAKNIFEKDFFLS